MEIRTGHAISADLKLYYEDMGDVGDPPVLLIMGLGAQLLLWRTAFCEKLVGPRHCSSPLALGVVLRSGENLGRLELGRLEAGEDGRQLVLELPRTVRRYRRERCPRHRSHPKPRQKARDGLHDAHCPAAQEVRLGAKVLVRSGPRAVRP